MSGVNKFNKQEYLEKIGKMTDSEFMKEWDNVAGLLKTKIKDAYVVVRIVKGKNNITSTGRRFTYGKSEK